MQVFKKFLILVLSALVLLQANLCFADMVDEGAYVRINVDGPAYNTELQPNKFKVFVYNTFNKGIIAKQEITFDYTLEAKGAEDKVYKTYNGSSKIPSGGKEVIIDANSFVNELKAMKDRGSWATIWLTVKNVKGSDSLQDEFKSSFDIYDLGTASTPSTPVTIPDTKSIEEPKPVTDNVITENSKIKVSIDGKEAKFNASAYRYERPHLASVERSSCKPWSAQRQ